MSKVAWNTPEAFALTAFRCPSYGKRKLEDRAVAASKLHSLVGGWIEAAPVLVCALKDDRYYQALYDHACQHGKLNDALRIVGIPTPMRKQSAAEVAEWSLSSAWLDAFPLVGDSTIAQLLTRVQGEARSTWRRSLDAIWRRKPRLRVRYEGQSEAFANWAVNAAAFHPFGDIAAAMDLMEDQDCNLSWSMARFDREHAQWIERMRHEYAADREAREAIENENERQRVKALDIEVSFGHRPLSGTISGIQFVALNSPRKLMDEGYKMRHCVGSAQFRDALRRGRAFYYHLSNGVVSSTLEIQHFKGVDQIGQHCAACNHRPVASLEAAARDLLRHFAKLQQAIATPNPMAAGQPIHSTA